jgi:WD40 repeat protein
MRSRPLLPRFLVLVLSVLVSAAGSRDCRAADAAEMQEIEIAKLARTTPVDFAAEILPILKANCLACHHGSNAKADLDLETPQAMLQGGTSGPAVVPGESEKSRLLQVAAHRVKPKMPPPRNRVGAKVLTPEELGLIRLWIDQGAKGSAASRPAKIAWQPPAASLQPILAVALTPDAKYVACSRADQLFVYDLPALKLVTRLVDPELPGGRAHVDFVRSLAFSPQGDLLASGGFRTVKLWQRPRTQQKTTFPLDDVASAVAINPAGTLAAFALSGGRMVLYDLASGKRLREFADPEAKTSVTRSLCFSPDGSRLYAAAVDKVVRIRKVDDGSTVGTFTTPAVVHGLAVLADGSLASAHEDGQLRAWDVAGEKPVLDGKAKLLAEIKAHSRAITSVVTVPSAPGQVITGSDDGLLRHWDIRAGKLLRDMNHGGAIVAVAVRPDGTRFASVGNQAVRLWDPTNGALVVERKGDHRAVARVREAEGEIGFAKLYLYQRQQELREAEETVKRETATLDMAKKMVEQAEKTLAEKRKAVEKPRADKMATEAAAVAAAEALEAANLARQKAATAVDQARQALGVAQQNAGRAKATAAKEPANADLAKASATAEKATTEAAAQVQSAEKALKAAFEAIQAVERKSREAAMAANQAREKVNQAEAQLKEAETAVETAQFTVNTSRQVLERDMLVPRAKQAVAAAEKVVQQREAAKKTAEEAVRGTERPWRSVAFSSDGAWLLVAGGDALVHVFDAQQGFPAEVLEAPGGAVVQFAAGARGKLVSLGAEKQAAVWETAGAWKLLRTIGSVDDPKTIADRVLKLDFHPSGKWLATAGGEPGRSGELKIWNTADGTLVREFPVAHRDTIFGVQFSPNGELLATAGADRLVKIFSTADGKLLHTLAGHTHHVRGVAWRADGKVLASCGADNVIKVWNAADGTLLRTETGDINRLRDYRREVTSISFIGSSEIMLAACGDKTFRMHYTTSAHYVRNFDGQSTFLYSAVATPDGKVLIAGGHDGVLRVWNGDSTYLIRDFPPAGTATEGARK